MPGEYMSKFLCSCHCSLLIPDVASIINWFAAELWKGLLVPFQSISALDHKTSNSFFVTHLIFHWHCWMCQKTLSNQLNTHKTCDLMISRLFLLQSTFAIVSYRNIYFSVKSLSNLASIHSVILGFFKDSPFSLVRLRLESVSPDLL